MQYLLNLTTADGVDRDDFVRHLQEEGVHPDTWELVKHRIVSDFLFKVGETAGLIVFLDAGSLDEAREIANGLPIVKSGMVQYELDPVSKVAAYH